MKNVTTINTDNVTKFLGEISINNVDQFVKQYGINTGSFKGLNVGDWFISKVNVGRERIVVFRIADFDPYTNSFSTASFQHNICIIPEISMIKAPMYKWAEDWESHGYGPSHVNQVIMPKLDKAMTEVFGDHLLEYSELLTIDAKGNVEPAMVKGILMSEMEVFGENKLALSEKEPCINRQLALFTKYPNLAEDDNWDWLRDISKYHNYTDFVYCDTNGAAGYGNSVDYTCGIRPRYLIG